MDDTESWTEDGEERHAEVEEEEEEDVYRCTSSKQSVDTGPFIMRPHVYRCTMSKQSDDTRPVTRCPHDCVPVHSEQTV